MRAIVILQLPSVFLVIGAVTSLMRAQTTAPRELRFEVASVRPNHTAECRGRWHFAVSHGTVTAENAPFLRIISRAFNLTDDRVSGPSWMDSQCYDIRAKGAGAAADQDAMSMLRTLLKERFHLAAQREAEERAIFALVVDKGGTKLRPFGETAAASRSNGDGKILFMAKTLSDLCERLGKVTGRPVVDKTGLDGDYTIVLTYLPFGSASSDASDPPSDIFSAVRDQLGLRLEPQRGIVDVLRIQSVDKIPTEN
jgi:uncharacterized protein (TIGR03435 family)